MSGGVPPYETSWVGTPNGQNLSSGFYDFSVLDAAGCFEIFTIPINDPQPLSANLIVSTRKNVDLIVSVKINISIFLHSFKIWIHGFSAAGNLMNSSIFPFPYFWRPRVFLKCIIDRWLADSTSLPFSN